MTNTSPTRRWFSAAAAASAILLASACGLGQYDTQSSTESSSATFSSDAASTTVEQSATASESASATTSDGTADSSGSYVAGEYDAVGSYQTPGGEESVSVEVTIEADGTITDVVVTGQADSGNSVQYQSAFSSGIADVVVGQSITDLSVSKVAGSSLTSSGFNAAIEQIAAEALA